MNRLYRTSTPIWRYIAGFALVVGALLIYATLHVYLPYITLSFDVFQLATLIILQMAVFSFTAYAQNLTVQLRRGLPFVLLFTAALLLPTPAHMLFLLVTFLVSDFILPEPTDSPAQTLGQTPLGMQVVIHGVAGAITRYFSQGHLVTLHSIQFVPIAFAAIATYLTIHYVLNVGAAKLHGLMQGKPQAVDNEKRNQLFVYTLAVSLGYCVAVLWADHLWVIFTGLIAIGLLIRQSNFMLELSPISATNKNALMSREAFQSRLAAEFEHAKQFHRPLSLILADVDNMRHINTAHGYVIGDQVLQGIAEVIKDTCHDYAFLGQWQGKIFAILAPELDIAASRKLAQQLCDHIDAQAFVIAAQPDTIRATLSVGVTQLQDSHSSANQFASATQQALTRAKMMGRNRVATSEDVPHSARLNFSNHTDPQAPSPAFSPASSPSSSAASTANTAITTPASSNASKNPPIVIGTARNLNKQRQWLYIFAVVAFAIVSSVALSWPQVSLANINWPSLLVMAGLAVMAQFLQVELYGTTSMSVAVAISFASLMLDGIPGLVVCSAAIALAHRFRELRSFDVSVLYKTAFNWGVHVLAGLLPFGCAYAFGLDLKHSDPIMLIGFAIFASMQIFAVESGLMAVIISFSQGRPATRVWHEQYRWLLGHYVTLCLLGLFLAIGYSSLGILGLIAFTLPVVMMHYSQRQYVERTATNLQELRRMNEEISVANEEIRAASQAIGQLNNELFLTLSKIIDMRDPFALGHASKVAQYATAIAEEMQLSQAQHDLIWQVALVHDIGKLGIPENILEKPGALTVEEFELLKTHSQLGADMLELSHGLRHLAPYVKTHHENYGGGGYPDNISGEKIPLETRIVTLADAVDAMASDRPYHTGMKPSAVLSEINRCRGEQFDPVIVDAFMKIIDQHGENYITNSANQVQMVRVGAGAGLANGLSLTRATAWPYFLSAPSTTNRLEITRRG